MTNTFKLGDRVRIADGCPATRKAKNNDSADLGCACRVGTIRGKIYGETWSVKLDNGTTGDCFHPYDLTLIPPEPKQAGPWECIGGTYENRGDPSACGILLVGPDGSRHTLKAGQEIPYLSKRGAVAQAIADAAVDLLNAQAARIAELEAELESHRPMAGRHIESAREMGGCDEREAIRARLRKENAEWEAHLIDGEVRE